MHSGRKIDLQKIEVIIDDLEKHPKIGIENPGQLKHELTT